jgi:hypothetical protein
MNTERNDSKEQPMKVQSNVRAGLVMSTTIPSGGSLRCSGVVGPVGPVGPIHQLA